MSLTETAITFSCGGQTLVGIVAEPAAASEHGTAPARTGMVVVVGGPQYRAGSHRQFTLLARDTAAAGWPTLRFDVRGMGDSTGAQRSFEALDDDIAAAIDALLHHCPALDRVVLWGLCDGASAALMYLQRRRDPRVQGLCLANPWVRSEAGLARTHVKHYYAQRLLQPAFWKKLISGKVGLRALGDLASTVNQIAAGSSSRPGSTDGKPLNFRQTMLRGLEGFLPPSCWCSAETTTPPRSSSTLAPPMRAGAVRCSANASSASTCPRPTTRSRASSMSRPCARQ